MYIVVENAKIAIKPVTLGMIINKNILVLNGLKAGDKVVVEDIIKLKPGEEVKIADTNYKICRELIMISRFFINRLVFAAVISIMIVLAGLISMYALPIAQYPNILPTTITVSTTYLGASPEVIATTVAAPLEEQINGVENMLYLISTSSSSGQLSITITFAIVTDPPQTEIDVNNRVQAVLSKLPVEVRQNGLTVNRASDTILGVVALFSSDKSLDTLFISNYAVLNVLDDLKIIEGVGNASLFGASNYAMRVWLNRIKCPNIS